MHGIWSSIKTLYKNHVKFNGHTPFNTELFDSCLYYYAFLAMCAKTKERARDQEPPNDRTHHRRGVW